MSQQQTTHTPRKKTLFNDWRQPHPTSDAPVDGSKYPAQLMWTQANNGRILLTVSDGVYNKEQGNKHKEVEMDWGDRNFLMEAILEASLNPEFDIRQIPIRKKDFVRTGGQTRMSDQAITKVNLIVARTKDGKIMVKWMKGDYKVNVVFKGPRETTAMMRGPDGQMVEDAGIASRWAARAWVNYFREPLDVLERAAWEPPKPKEGATNNNNSGGYNNNRNSNNGGGSGGGAADYDDDDFADF